MKNNSLEYYFHIESLYELGVDFSQVKNEVDPKICLFLKFIYDSEFNLAYSYGENLLEQFENNQNNLVQAFVLNWLIICAEKQYNRDAKKKYYARLKQISLTSDLLYIEFLIDYFLAIDYFYDGSLSESELIIYRALDKAEELNYNRGKVRCLLHLAYINTDAKKQESAMIFLQQAEELAFAFNFKVTLNKIYQEKNRINQNDQIKKDYTKRQTQEQQDEQLLSLIETSIATKDFKYARKLIVQAELLRRKRGYSKKKWTLIQYLIQVKILTGRRIFAKRLIFSVTDDFIKRDLIAFAINHHLAIDEQMKNIMNKLDRNYSNNKFSIVKISPKVRISIDKISDRLTRLLLKSFLHNMFELSKDQVMQSVFGLPYDPVLHDAKVYKLINRAKKELPANSIKNEYGNYVFNTVDYDLEDQNFSKKLLYKS